MARTRRSVSAVLLAGALVAPAHVLSADDVARCDILEIDLRAQGKNPQTLAELIKAAQVLKARPFILRGGVDKWVSKAPKWWNPSGPRNQSPVEALVAGFGTTPFAYGDPLETALFGPPQSSSNNPTVLFGDMVDDADADNPKMTFTTEKTFSSKLMPKGEWKQLFTAMQAVDNTFSVASIAPEGLGLPFHVHSDATLGLIVGSKHWAIVPPGEMVDTLLNHPLRVNRTSTNDCPSHGQALCCTQHAGDIVFVPSMWWHATVNRKHDQRLTVGIGGQLEANLHEPSVAGFERHFTLRGFDNTKWLNSPVYRQTRARHLAMGNDDVGAVADMMIAWSGPLPSWHTTSWHLLNTLAAHGGGDLIPAIFRVIRNRVDAFITDPTLDMSATTRAAIILRFAHLVGAGTDVTKAAEKRPEMLQDVVEMYEQALEMYDAPAGVWRDAAYAQLTQARATRGSDSQNPNAMKPVQRKLWRALEIDPTFQPAIDALNGLRLPLPPKKAKRKEL